MGSLTEAYAYMHEGRKTQLDIKNKYWYITITPKLKSLKREYKWYKSNEAEING